MKRSEPMEKLTYDVAIKKAQLVERNSNPIGTTLVNPLRMSFHEDTDIISLASQIQLADKNLQNSACGKLALILDQIRMLQAQAKNILEETETNRLLHSAACNFNKKPGNVYHLYKRASGQSYFSMLSPEEWSGACQQEFLGSYRLEHDSTWTSLEKIKERDEKMQWAQKCLTSSINLKNVSLPSIESPIDLEKIDE